MRQACLFQMFFNDSLVYTKLDTDPRRGEGSHVRSD
jgi:hypothetical protein